MSAADAARLLACRREDVTDVTSLRVAKNVHRASPCFHHSQRNNKNIVHGDNLNQPNSNDLPIREYLVTLFSLIYRCREAMRGIVSDRERSGPKMPMKRYSSCASEPRQAGLCSCGHKDPAKKFKRKYIAHPWRVVSVRNIKSLSY
ncbi:hypothetical protein LGN17_03150 [Burkholderia sp. AU30280]|uniref:hypothetical protein n=1 Tax=Burkholderia sp. AU30280 TaxID=2879628 RepID=UPI001CF4A7DB|nr:hypothetical protein [Burkholderia sp. AU30280]MCA8271519.1 hypothetical protein [Burkholderia sp. AU30280]